MRLFLSFLLACTGSFTLFSQTATTGLTVGEQCPSIMANTSDHSIQSDKNAWMADVNRRTEFRFYK